MIKINKLVNVAKDVVIKDEETRRRFVPSTETWIAIDKPSDITYIIADITIEDKSHKAVGYMLNNSTDKDTYLIGATGLDYNSLYYASTLTKGVSVPKSVTIGHFDSLYRRKYLTIPHNSYWDNSGLPIVISK